MDEDSEYALTWTAPGGKPVGPVMAVTTVVHTVARNMVDVGGGTVQVLRAAGSGWREVARYSAMGGPSLAGI